jgi:condensin complex subunit 3
MVAKDKTIRYRATQLIAHIVNTLDSIDDQLFHLVRHGLLKRLRDKESTVRVQAVIGLGPLANEDDEDQDEDESDDETPGGVLGRLREALQHDPSADVRRALLLNLPFTPGTLPYLLERARDLDAATRRALYARLLPALGDFRHLSLTHREKLLRWGLRDRDENVRKATARLFRERWIEDCAALHDEAEEAPTGPPKVSEPSMDALLELLERIDVNNSGLENGIAHEAMKEFWDGRPDYRDHITFEDPFFDELSPESAFVARTFTDFCFKSGDSRLQTMLEDKMPEVTKFAFLLQMHIARLVDAVNKVGMNPDDPEAEEEAVQQEFCLEQLLHIGATLDFSDEMGRRKMFQIMREALALAELPDESTRLVMDILRTVCGSEEEFASIALEAIAEVHDTIQDDAADASDADESFHSAQSELSGETTPTKKSKKQSKNSANEDDTEIDEEKAIREIQVNLKCLHIAQCMLQNVQCNLEASSHLRTMLNSLIIPAVQSHEAPVRERGLRCMGLCCLLSKNLSEENLVLFLHCFNKGHEALQEIAIQIISDILVTHPSLLASTPKTDEEGNTEMEPNPLVKPLLKMYSKGLRSADKTVQTTAGTALSKLMLAATIQNLDLLRQMVLSYFDPETQGNPSLRQSLAYFLPVYCHSRRRNAEAMGRVAVPVLHALAERAEDLDEEEEMIGTTLVAAQICDWTDPRKTVPGVDGTVKTDPGELDGHLVLAEELLEKILTPGCQSQYSLCFH